MKWAAGVLLASVGSVALSGAVGVDAVSSFQRTVEPILIEYCYDCHGDGMSRGGMAFDGYESKEALVSDQDLWSAALKYLRANLMPPHERRQLPESERRWLEHWIKREAFGIDPANPDPGRVTLRRLNRIEYRNTIRDLTGVEYNTLEEFPPDDTGYGFDTVGDVLTVSPLLLEKYLQAAETIALEATRKAGQNRPNRLFPRESHPSGGAERRTYTRSVLERFAGRAFRRPVDEETLDRLVKIAEAACSEPGQSFETGMGQAIMGVLTSPRFLFRVEKSARSGPGEIYSRVDEYSLASRLSYFLWSTMPDDELLDLAHRGELRSNLAAQVDRLLRDPRSEALIENFAGQWLQARDVEGVSLNERAILRREGVSRRLELDRSLRLAMRRETEMYFAHVIREDRSLVELLDSNYTFLNEKLAEFYGIPEVSGNKMRRVTLPAQNPRGGILTQGTVLTVTSNPTRTSPVKRGMFILDNILGIPPPPPPPDIPDLAEAEKQFEGGRPTLREAMEAHRSNALCRSCHARMDPLGLALENFNALGLWRETERDRPIDASGQLITGESFQNIRELKRILSRDRRLDFYRCLTEKLLTYALGRGLEYYDVHSVDQIVARLEESGGRSSALLMGVIESPPFQCRRNPPELAGATAGQPQTPQFSSLP